MTIKQLVASSIIIYICAAGVSYVGARTFGVASVGTPKVANVPTEPTIPPEPLTEECPTNGKMYGKTAKAKWEKRRPLGVVIENHQESRPQSGISNADVVYEGVSEGGVTRTLSIFTAKMQRQSGQFAQHVFISSICFVNGEIVLCMRMSEEQIVIKRQGAAVAMEPKLTRSA